MNDFLKDQNGNPMLLVGLQAHNSSTGTDMIAKTIRAIRLYGGNLLEAPIYWYAIEPSKDQYDMTLLKDLIDQTRETGLKLIILWFATSKNGHPNYAPEYIKLAPETYRLAIGPDGAPVASLSPHCMATLTRDKLAFCKMMEFIKEYDGAQKTIVAVQIENEMGYANTDRDYSKLAQADYARPLPQELKAISLEDTGIASPDGASWRGHFGRHAHEAFSAWYHARYIGAIAQAGKQVYDVPMITNVMVGEQRYEEAGKCYNGGAAVGRVLDIWKAGAPALDLICPDIYNTAKREYTRICDRYTREDNALFIPESPTGGEANAMNMITAVGEYGAIGVCCFGAESALCEDGTLTEEARPVAISMNAIAALAPLLIKYRGTGNVHAFVQDEFSANQYLRLPRYHVTAHFMRGAATHYNLGSRINLHIEENKWRLRERGRGLLVQTGEDEFFLSGAGLALEFIRRPDPRDENPYIHLSSRQAGQLNFLSVEEGHFEGEKWVVDYLRNGDESNFNLYAHDGQAVRIRLNPNIGMDVE